MALLTQATELSITGYVTIREGARIKGVSYGCLLMWLRNHNVPVKRIDKHIMVSTAELEQYQPMRRYVPLSR